MPHNITCIISNSWHEILILHVNILASMYWHKIFTHCMLFNYHAITPKRSLNWDLNTTRHHPASMFETRNKTRKKKLFYFFFSEIVSLSRQRFLYHDIRSFVPRLPVVCMCALPRLLVGRVASIVHEVSVSCTRPACRTRCVPGRRGLLARARPNELSHDSLVQNPEIFIFFFFVQF